MNEREPGGQPLDDATTACVLVFAPIGRMYQPLSALAVLAGLNAREFSGVCECYLRPDVADGEYLMGVGLRFDEDAPEAGWWGAFADDVRDACTEDAAVRLNRPKCGFSTVGELRSGMLHAGTAAFESGSAVWVSDPAGPDPDSPFTGLIRRIFDDAA